MTSSGMTKNDFENDFFLLYETINDICKHHCSPFAFPPTAERDMPKNDFSDDDSNSYLFKELFISVMFNDWGYFKRRYTPQIMKEKHSSFVFFPFLFLFFFYILCFCFCRKWKNNFALLCII